MKKHTIIIITISLLYSLYTKAQNSHGVLHYGEVQSLATGGLSGYDYNALLVFNTEQSLYATRKDSLEKKSVSGKHKYVTAEGGAIFGISSSPQGFLYATDRKKDSVFSRDIGFRYTADTTPKIPWKIAEETKKIGPYTAQKATAPFRGRKYTAWFTSEIPLPFGPWKLQGLPGMILEAYDTDKSIYWYFKAIKYPCDDCSKFLKSIEKPKDTNWLNFHDYKTALITGHKNTLLRTKIALESMDPKFVAKANAYVPEFNMRSTYIEVFEDPEKNKQ